MKSQLGPLVGQLSGKIGGMVASRNRYGTYFRRRAHPTRATSELAIATKSRLSTASNGWIGLTDAQREAWRVWAANNPIVDRLGEKQVLQGNAAFVKINALRLRILGAMLSVPPVVAAPNGLTEMSLTGDIGAGAFGVVFAATPLAASQRLLCWGALTENADIQYVQNKWRIVGYSTKAKASPYDWQSEFVARFGSLAVGQCAYCLAYVYDDDTGLWSQPMRDSIVLTST